ncbi:putative membrane protein [Pectobacterium atrosepticum SCRI1043]|uniref:Membrane protein n=1 Tax=Pectobacterium atrosepticum (strain SCRI 1043 / ATCC BAA-672) TaxID=218491 RepID=Q6D9U9_PECAS|nr:putative membrane protein [Pectobacterium atrosepticum SCRI1043]
MVFLAKRAPYKAPIKNFFFFVMVVTMNWCFAVNGAKNVVSSPMQAMVYFSLH